MGSTSLFLLFFLLHLIFGVVTLFSALFLALLLLTPLESSETVDVDWQSLLILCGLVIALWLSMWWVVRRIDRSAKVRMEAELGKSGEMARLATDVWKTAAIHWRAKAVMRLAFAVAAAGLVSWLYFIFLDLVAGPLWGIYETPLHDWLAGC